ncbi:hypothetical protein MHB40_25110 [Lysinibacillus sp. FSL K6-0057]|uniref:hypothetical protein n=1 Tax=Lysinibacillus sp. FSL K6-0057 TaxID=2921411 RepID=UPI00315B0999
MTAEICVINKLGVALGADSAVTIGNGKKIYNSANKLFALSKYAPVGIMIYNNASFVGVPFETIIKLFRKNLGESKHPNLIDYGNAFIEFLVDNGYSQICTNREVDKHLLQVINAYLEQFYSKYIRSLKATSEEKNLSGKQLLIFSEELLEKMLDNETDRLDKKNILDCFEDTDTISNELESHINGLVNHIFKSLIFSEEIFTKILNNVWNHLIKEFSPYSTGIVIAGFGEDEVLPLVFDFKIDGIVEGTLKISDASITDSSEEQYNTILPFAQSEVVELFLNGIDPNLERYQLRVLKQLDKNILNVLEESIKTTFNNPIKVNELLETTNHLLQNKNNSFIELSRNYQENNFRKPIKNIVKILPKEELSEMAETLIHITSFKRKSSDALETVGGPIDVALITKGDGFVWIKRKHYFTPEINHSFYNKYFKED